MIYKLLTSLLMIAVLSACSFVPSAGPSASRIAGQAEADGTTNYMIVQLDRPVSTLLSRYSSKALSERFSSKHTHTHAHTIGVGDILNITVFEAGEGGLFASSSGRSANFPTVQVSEKGQISLPYAGVINVDGDTPLRVQNKIVARLQGQAIEPQVLVNVAENQSNAAVVGGDITNPGRYPLNLGETTLLDLIALAGGASGPTRETFVTFIRGGTKGRQLLHTIIDGKGENIKINAGDRIILRHEPEAFVVLGAVGRPGNYPMTSTRTNLLEAIASANGFQDERANRHGLFVFRFEDRAVASQLGDIPADIDGDLVPVVYRLNLQEPVYYFVAREFIVKNKDAIFAANSPFVDLRKIVSLFTTAVSPAARAVSFSNAISN